MVVLNTRVKGYGLFTRSFLGLDRYYASASFSHAIEIIEPPIDLAMLDDFKEISGYESKNKHMKEFNDPVDFKNITEAELEPVQAQIIAYFKSLANLAVKHLQQQGVK